MTPHEVTSNSTYSNGLSITCRKESECQYLGEKQDQYLLEIVNLKAKLDIDKHWGPNDPEYLAMVEYSATQDYHQVLDQLQHLVVQRLFELHKLNLNFTGVW